MSVWIVYEASSKNPLNAMLIFDSLEKAENFKFDLCVGLRIHPDEVIIEERQVF